jgi:hypothetical protein
LDFRGTIFQIFLAHAWTRTRNNLLEFGDSDPIGQRMLLLLGGRGAGTGAGQLF